MNRYILLILALIIITGETFCQTPVPVIKGEYKSSRSFTELKTFTASQGDVIEVKVTSLHKKKGVDLFIEQHPGDLKVLEIEETMSTTKKINVPADAIYRVCYAGRNNDFQIEIINHTSKPEGPERGIPQYVRIPDTLHVSGYVDKEIGESITFSPYTEKVVFQSYESVETLVTKNFTTGRDFLILDIPGNTIDDYREQKLLSFSVNLTTDAPNAYGAMLDVVKVGIDEFTPSYSDIVGAKVKKFKKSSSSTSPKFVNNITEESNKMETFHELVDIGDDAIEVYEENKYGTEQSETGQAVASNLSTATFFMDDDGIKELALSEATNIPGVAGDMAAIIEEVINVPDPADLLKAGVDQIAPKIDGVSQIIIDEWHPQLIPGADMEALGEVWIQSALNYGKDMNGFWDLPGSPTSPEKGQNLGVWALGEGDMLSPDRKFKFVEVPGTNGEYYYIKTFGNSASHRLDISGGPIKTKINGSNAQVWENIDHEGQMFKVIHLGNGKIIIRTHSGYDLNLDKRSSANGSNIHIWEPHTGAWNEWYIVSPTTKTKLIPKDHANGRQEDFGWWSTIHNSKGSMINTRINIAGESDAIDENLTHKRIRISVGATNGDAKATMGVLANYLVTDYTDVIKYNEIKDPVTTKDFWTSYKIKYRYAIMFKDQMRDYYQGISKNEYYNNPLNFEVGNSSDPNQKTRLMKYNILTTN